MSDYTPTTEEVRTCFSYDTVARDWSSERKAEFDRWLAEVKAKQDWETTLRITELFAKEAENYMCCTCGTGELIALIKGENK